jgi:MoaA/NifB/PqqE/SkfB family radical SAM enzyme
MTTTLPAHAQKTANPGTVGLPTDAVVAVTLNCNARCTMCDIWKNRMEGELQPEEFAALPASLRTINITGGEPFLRDDLPDILRVIRRTCQRARLVISTNGFLPRRAARLAPLLREMPDLAVRISIDGIGDIHDRIRGTQGAFQRCLEFLNQLRELGVRDLGFNLTLMEHNWSQLTAVYKLSRSLGVELGVTVVTDSPLYFGVDKQPLRPDQAGIAPLQEIAHSEYRRWRPGSWVRGWYEKGLVEYLLRGHRPLPCDAGRGFFYLDALGNVFGCHVRGGRLGNLREHSFEQIWHSGEAAAARTQLSGCQQCWMVCTAKSAVRTHWWSVLGEVVSDKARAHLQRPEALPGSIRPQWL